MEQNILRSPAVQALAAGALTLIPARNYPRWLRTGLVWGPAIAATAYGAYLAKNPAHRTALFERFGGDEAADQSGALSRPGVVLASTAGLGVFIGASSALGFWVDERLERGLQRLRVPAPRVVMAVAAGALTWVAERADTKGETPHSPVS